ncbi:MAG TPA: DUF4235 domain-containing protein [Solirubrobacterales bacterium]
MTKVLFIPVSIVSGLLAGLIGKKAFEAIWGKIDDEEPPAPEHRDIDLRRMALALVIQGAIFTLVRGAVDHAMRVWFYGKTHRWPGEEEPEPA